MTVLETETMTIVRSNMPKVVRLLERIADALEDINKTTSRTDCVWDTVLKNGDDKPNEERW